MKRYGIGMLLVTGIFIRAMEKKICKKFSEQHPERWYVKEGNIYIEAGVDCFAKTVNKVVKRFESYKKILPLFTEPYSSKTEYLVSDIYDYFTKHELCNHTAIESDYKKLISRVNIDNHDLLAMLHLSWITYQRYCDIKKKVMILHEEDSIHIPTKIIQK